MSAQSSPDFNFALGNAADELYGYTIGICGRKSDRNPRMPRALYDTFVDDVVSTCRDVHANIFAANGIHDGKIDFLGFAYHLTDTGKVVKRLLKSKRKTERNLLRKKVGQLAAGEITADALAKSYESWRAHALQGDTHAFVKATDVWLNALLAPHGWQLIVTGKHNRRIKITKCQEH